MLTESQFRTALEQLGCAGNSFAEICGLISKAELSRCLSGQKSFSPEDTPKLFAALREMQELAAQSATPLNWKQTQIVRAALNQRRAIRKLIEDVDRVVREGALLREQYRWIREQ
jgi:hypothetical protein